MTHRKGSKHIGVLVFNSKSLCCKVAQLLAYSWILIYWRIHLPTTYFFFALMQRNINLFDSCQLIQMFIKFQRYLQERNVCLFLARQPPVGHGLLIHEVSRSHTTTHHSQEDSSGWVISSSQRPLPDNTQHSQQTNIHAPVGFEPTISAGERPHTCALDRTTTGTGKKEMYLQEISPDRFNSVADL